MLGKTTVAINLISYLNVENLALNTLGTLL